MNTKRNDIRNIAIIAHVDHGKTTLVDGMLKQSGIFRQNQKVEERIMDSNEIERERGITILAKNTAVTYNGIKINIIDTPGHADFGGEVERVLKMVDGVLLLVDAFEGPMPQTRFVLKKALALDLPAIVVINKIDRPDARVNQVLDEILELFIDLGANDSQIEFPVIYASARDGYAKLDLNDTSNDLKPLFEAIINYVPAPVGDPDAPVQVLITTLDYDEYVGRIAIGRVFRGTIIVGQEYAVCKKDGSIEKVKISNLFEFNGLKREPAESATVGDIIAVTGIEDIEIGETIADAEKPEPVPYVNIDEPTLSMIFSVNNSPFAGKEGEYITSRHLRDRLFKEARSNVSLRVEETDSPDKFKVSGRGELHLSVLIETMRREGFEFQVSKPTVIMKEVNGKIMEPIESVVIDVPEAYVGIVMEKMGMRRGQLLSMENLSGNSVRLEFEIPTRGLLGYRSEFITDTKGEGIINSVFAGFAPYKGDIPTRNRGSLIAFETGESNTYGLYNAQERGTLFIGPQTKVYEGMIVGENSRPDDLDINVCKKKHITNLRSSTAEETLRLTPPKEMTLEKCLEFIADDELLEVTPKSLRMRKAVLSRQDRQKMKGRTSKVN
ncbi:MULTISPECIES: translational GTPase TypA [Tepidanaerobacter]|uniref:Large ribosomal subunit assembly factor BipA n=1 Tax=Tepidanaerobacter syntrophicus TaxID=224999 RepID=A0A0U9HCA3_9FIRM|nr:MULTISPECIES: translational GTPase TypA [Tepidanaerobacter]GAQ24421.1 GTP-binding protein [Tepidanaerobacter syntrophicus]GLI52053.1 GTP-binding protein [Tepidanaerobacter syntrophicus]HHV83994.1 translational GTPase TypA [Tepidanaerobacter syntrophicus]